MPAKGTAAAMIAQCESFLGTHESSNDKVHVWYAARNGAAFRPGSVPACDMFITWAAYHSGAYATVCFNKDYAYTPYHAAAFKAHTKFVWGTKANVDKCKAGDIVFFDWGGKETIGGTDHVGIVKRPLGNGRVETIENNTSDRCLRRVRSHADISCIGKPAYVATPAPFKSRLVLDYAFKPHPSVRALRQGNVHGVVRYVSHSPSKNATKSELDSYGKQGIASALVWETTAKRAADGHDAGVSDAREAARQARTLGQPTSEPIYFAVDWDTTGPTVEAYFKGVVSVLGAKRTGVYAGIRVVDYLTAKKLVAYRWQTLAWSGGKWSKHNQLEQYAVERNFAGCDVDYNRTKHPNWGQWINPHVIVKPTPVKPAVPSGKPNLKVGSRGGRVRQLQTALNYISLTPKLKVDGDFGEKTANRVAMLQRRAKLHVDEVYGPLTAKALSKQVKAH